MDSSQVLGYMAVLLKMFLRVQIKVKLTSFNRFKLFLCHKFMTKKMNIIKDFYAQDVLKTIEKAVKGSNEPFNHGSFQLVVILPTICIVSVRLYRCSLLLIKIGFL